MQYPDWFNYKRLRGDLKLKFIKINRRARDTVKLTNSHMEVTVTDDDKIFWNIKTKEIDGSHEELLKQMFFKTDLTELCALLIKLTSKINQYKHYQHELREAQKNATKSATELAEIQDLLKKYDTTAT